MRQPAPEDRLAEWEVVDAFLAAREGNFERLIALLAPDAQVSAEAVAAGTPERIAAQHPVVEFFDGSARDALPVFVDGRPGAAWFHRGEARVLFDFTVVDGTVSQITFRAEPDVLARLTRRDHGSRRE